MENKNLVYLVHEGHAVAVYMQGKLPVDAYELHGERWDPIHPADVWDRAYEIEQAKFQARYPDAPPVPEQAA